MLIPTIIMGVLAIALVAIGYSKGQHIIGIKSGLSMAIKIIPLLIFAFIVAGMAQVLIPREFILKWIGQGSGFKGLMIGTFAGMCTPGGPYVSLPIAAGFLSSGASIGTITSFVTGWTLLGLSRIPLEIGIMGWRFTLIRLLSVLLFAPIAGLIAQGLSKLIK